ncbi:MAG: hypothetical protein WBG48_08935 [Pricia sp.]
MNTSKTIQIVHAVDAEQHLGRLKKILEELKGEKRIDSYMTLASDAVNQGSFSQLQEEDMVIILLTNGIEPEKTNIESILLGVKASKPKVLMAEIIVDHVPYETQFIAFPQDLQPIRSRGDMDAVWSGIARNLRDIFPARQEPVGVAKPPFPWKKYLPYALGALALIFLFFLGPWGEEDDTVNEDAPVDFKIVNLKASLASPARFKGDCPHPFDFQGIIETNGPGKVAYTWLKSDGTQGPIDTLKFESAESLKVSTNWDFDGSGNKKYEEWQQLKILSPVDMVSNRALFNVECTTNNSTSPVADDHDVPPVEPETPINTGSVEITVVSPKSPRTLEVGERVNFNFKYSMNDPDGVFIWGRPMTNGSTTPNYAAHGAKIIKARQGTGSGFFTVTSPGKKVDQIRLQMWDADQKKLINETFVPVNYNFVASTTLTGVNADFTNMGNSRIVKSNDFQKQGIKRVKAKPSGNYCATAEPAILAKGGTSRSPVSYLSTATPNKLNSCNTIVLEFVFNSPVKQVTVYFYGAAVDNKLTAYRSNGTVIGSRTKKAVPYNYTKPYSVTYSSTIKNISRITFGYQAASTMITGIQGK